MATRRITIQAGSLGELERKTPRINLHPGSVGRLELIAPRVLPPLIGCLTPLGPLMGSPLVGSRLAEHLAPTGVVITDRGGIPEDFQLDCDAFLEWRVPEGQAQQGMARMGVVISLPTLVGLIVAALALGWAISQVRLLIDAIVPDTPAGFLGLALAVGLIVFGLGMTGQKRGKR
jgi:hypothetical protein